MHQRVGCLLEWFGTHTLNTKHRPTVILRIVAAAMIDIAVVAAPMLLVVVLALVVGTTHAQTFYVR
jgi:hypothetical protein